MKGKKWLSLLIVISMVVSFLPLAATATNYSDTQEHWAKAEIAKWSDLGILQGSGNLFRPSAPITRGEMAIILDRIMKYQAKASNSFVDLDQNWYTDAVLKANAAGIIQGDGKTVRPLDKITREEAAVMFGRALGLGESSGATSFADNASISTWAKGYINAMADKGLVGGVGGNQFAPKAYITRGEVVKMLDNAVKGFYTTADTQSGTVNGTAIVNADGATLKNMTINGDLIIAEGVGDGEVTLDSVKVAGQTIVRGGGENSVIVTGNSSLGKVIVSKKSDGAVSVKVTGNAKVDVVVAENGSINVSGTVSRLDVKGDVDVALVNAKVATINVQSAAVVAIDKGSVVTTVSVDAPKANIAVSGTVTTVTASANATNAQITTTSTAKITSVVAQAQGTTISGTGSITTVKAEANNVAVSTPNTKVEAATGTTGVTAGGNTVTGGSSATTDNSGTGSTTTPPSGGGGGGGGSTDRTAPTLAAGTPIKVNFEDNQGTTQAVAAGGTVSFTPGNVVKTIEVTLTEAVNITGTVSITMTPSGDGAEPIQGYATVDKGASNVLVITPTNINYQTIKYGGTFTYSITNDASKYIADAAGNKLTPTEITLTFKAMPKLITEISVAARHDDKVLADGQPSHINDKKFTVAGDALDNTYTVTVTGTDVLESEKGDAPAEGKWMGIRFTLGGINDITTVKYGATNDPIDALTVDEAIAEADRYNSFMLYVDGNVTTTTRYIKDANGYVYTIVVNYTEYVDTTAPTVSSTDYKQMDNELVITFSKPVLFYLDDEDKSKVTDPATLLSSLYAVPINGGDGIELADESTTVTFGSNETLETGVKTITITNCKPIFIAEKQNFFLSVSNATVKSVVGIELNQSSVEKLKFEVKDVLTVVNTTENVALMKAALESPALGLTLTEYNQLNDGLKMKVAEYVLGNKSGGYINQDAVEDQFTAAVAAKKEAAEATTGSEEDSSIKYYDTLENALAADHATLKVDSYTVSKDLQAENNLTIPKGKTLILNAAQTGTGAVIVEADGAFQTPKVNIVGASNAYFTPTEDGTIVISPIENAKTKYVLNGTITVNKHTPEGGITIMSGDELDLSAAELTVNSDAGDADNATFIIKSGGKLTTAAANAFYFSGGEAAIPESFTAAANHIFTWSTDKWVSDIDKAYEEAYSQAVIPTDAEFITTCDSESQLVTYWNNDYFEVGHETKEDKILPNNAGTLSYLLDDVDGRYEQGIWTLTGSLKQGSIPNNSGIPVVNYFSFDEGDIDGVATTYSTWAILDPQKPVVVGGAPSELNSDTNYVDTTNKIAKVSNYVADNGATAVKTTNIRQFLIAFYDTDGTLLKSYKWTMDFSALTVTPVTD